MPTYAYTARDSAGAAIEGTIAGASVDDASKQLRAQNKYPIKVRPLADAASNAASQSNAARSTASVGRGGIKITRDEVIQISNQLSIMLDTGVTLSEALQCCADNAERPPAKKLLTDLADTVNAGVDFSHALSRHPRSFPRIYVALIKASEKSGMLSKLLTRATTYLKDEQEIIRKVRGALTYPGIMFSFAILTTIFLLAFVLPRFTTIYANKGAALPMPTKILMAISDGLVHQWMFIVPAVALVAGGAWAYLRTPGGKRTGDWIQINAPAVGPMFRKLHLSRGLRTLGTLASAGVTLTDCVETASGLCNNSYFGDLWADVSHQIQNGKPFSEPLGKSKLVPGSVTRMLAAGEKGGKLGQVMEQVAGFSEAELKEKINELTRYIEPAMIMLMGLLIGGVTLALLLPIFTISKVVAS
jgi:type II secretory pathway component PulF